MLTSPDDSKLNVNPMATRYVAPGRLPWIGSGETGLDSLVERFQQMGRRCQIIGPHGSGKSTLLEHLVPRLGSRIVRVDVNGDLVGDINGQLPSAFEVSSDEPSIVWWFTLRSGSGVMDRLNEFWRNKDFRGVLVLDGGEQLSWWRRWRLLSWARSHKCGLLVTSHSDLGLVTLLKTNVTPQLAKEVVRQAFSMACGGAMPPGKIAEIDWEFRLRERQGNLRECLMDLYDQVETLKREAR
jgi:hypothetical protein